MEKMFHARWWDYRQKPMNLHGRIWIGNLVLFGIGGVAIVKLIDPVLMKWIHAIPQWILYTLSGAIVMLMIWDNIVSHIAFNLVKKEIDGVEADNSEEVSTKVRQLLREDPVLLRRIGEAYPNLEINSKKFAEKLKAQAEAVQESVEAVSYTHLLRVEKDGRRNHHSGRHNHCTVSYTHLNQWLFKWVRWLDCCPCKKNSPFSFALLKLPRK